MRTGSASLTQGFDGSPFFDRIAADPLDGTHAPKHCGQQIADRQIFDLKLARGGLKPRPLEKTVAARRRATTSRLCLSRLDPRQHCWNQNSAHLHDVAPRALRPRRRNLGSFIIFDSIMRFRSLVISQFSHFCR